MYYTSWTLSFALLRHDSIDLRSDLIYYFIFPFTDHEAFQPRLKISSNFISIRSLSAKKNRNYKNIGYVVSTLRLFLIAVEALCRELGCRYCLSLSTISIAKFDEVRIYLVILAKLLKLQRFDNIDYRMHDI